MKKLCKRCGKSWPSDEEFYQKPNSLVCRACLYEQQLARARKYDARVRSDLTPEQKARKKERDRLSLLRRRERHEQEKQIGA
jgi:hypothetical protein